MGTQPAEALSPNPQENQSPTAQQPVKSNEIGAKQQELTPQKGWGAWFLRRPSFLELLALSVGLVGLVAAYVTIRLDHDIKMQVSLEKQNLDLQQADIKNIVSNISTSYLPEWPNHIEPLIDLVKGVKDDDQLEIQVDSIGYLAFTRAEAFDTFFGELVAAARRTKGNIRILTLNEQSSAHYGRITVWTRPRG